MNVRFRRSGAAPSQQARRLLGSKTGIVAELLHYLPDRADPDVFHSTAVESNLDRVAGTEVGPLDAGGTALDRSGSLTSALGEAAERYCLYFPDRSAFVEASHRGLATERTVDHEYLAVFDDEQCERVGLAPVDRDTTLRWQPAVDLLSGETVYVPAQLVWMGLADADRGPHYPTTSNGCACAGSPAGALAGALSEYIERDAIMRTWFRREPTRRTEPPAGSDVASTVARRFETDTLSIRFFEADGALDLPAVGCAAVDGRDRAPKVAVGGACSVDRRTAYLGALVEAAQTRAYLKDLLARDGTGTDIDPDHVYDLTDNLLLYARPENYGDVEFLLGGGPPAKPALDDGPDAPRAELEAYLDLCRDADVTPLAVDVTTDDVREVGFTAARVIVPELVGLALPSLPPAAHPALAGRDLNRKPHPYP